MERRGERERSQDKIQGSRCWRIGSVLTAGRDREGKSTLGHKSELGLVPTLQPTSCVTLGKLISCSGLQFPSKMKRLVQVTFAIASHSKSMILDMIWKYIEGFWESSWNFRNSIVLHLQSKYIFIWISVAFPTSFHHLSEASYCSHLPVFPWMHYPSHIPRILVGLPITERSSTPGFRDWPKGWAPYPRRPIRIFLWTLLCGYREKKRYSLLGM